MAVCKFGIFFFQAEDGIRDTSVTGVQTCALPISTSGPQADAVVAYLRFHFLPEGDARKSALLGLQQIGRASCRERVEMRVVAVSLKIKERERHTKAAY